MKKPHDPTDLLLSPVALALDERLEELGRMSPRELRRRVTWETNMAPRTVEAAARAIVSTVTYLIDTHGWTVSWDVRGLRLHHGAHAVVLGVPASVVEYVESVGGRIPAARRADAVPV